MMLAMIGLVTFNLQAQRPGGMGRRAMMNPEQRAERQAAIMQDSLLLSDETRADVQEVLTIYLKKMQESFQSANGDRASMRASLQTLRREQSEELAAIIGEEKWAQWEKMTSERRRDARTRGQERRRGGRQGKQKGGEG